jgi:membrane protein implicated in regulation of membrane protease activity
LRMGALETILWLAVVALAIVLMNVLLGYDLAFSFLARAAGRFLRSCAPKTADRLGLGGETVEPLGSVSRPEEMAGRLAEVERAIVAGEGRVRLGGVSWAASGVDAPPGAKVRVVSIDGNRLVVAPLDAD